jgi:flavorubredoxin
VRGKAKLFRIFLRCVAKLQGPRRMRVWQRRFFKAKRIAEEVLRMNNALIVYYSQTGNTEKTAIAIKKGIERAGKSVTIKRVEEAAEEDLYDYDLVCFGAPVHHCMPPAQVLEFIEKNDRRYRNDREVPLASPVLINKSALVFCTYSGPHCGLNEALPAGKYIRQFLEHLGFDVKDEWYEVGEFHGWREASVHGRLGDITGRPHDDDLNLVELKAAQLARSL